MLRVRGDSMIEAGILDGDFVICPPAAPTADNGDIVVAGIPGEEATVKFFSRNRRRSPSPRPTAALQPDGVPRQRDVSLYGRWSPSSAVSGSVQPLGRRAPPLAAPTAVDFRAAPAGG